MDWMLMPLRRYADFSGRSRRKEYWMFLLLQLILYAAVALVALVLFSADDGNAGFGLFSGMGLILFLIIILALFIPTLAVTVRRFHDQDKSGWFVLLNFIPYIGGIIVFVFMCLEGTRGPNRFGDDPKGESSAQIFA
jgi:uncharacterized membrane protein YhaH (DUF805 family)